MPRPLALCVAACAILLGTVAPASAAPSLTLATSADPIEAVAAQVIATGRVESTSGRIYVKRKPAGGVGCAANPSADDGDTVIEYPTPTGPFSETRNQTFSLAGTYLLCGWLTDTSQPTAPIIATATLTFNVRIPNLALGVAAPPVVGFGDTFQVVTTAQSETRREAWVWVLPDTGRGCPANSSAADGPGDNVVYGWAVTGGPFSRSDNVRLTSSGPHLLCAYFQYLSGRDAPQAVASAAFTVLPPCLVPPFTPGALTLAQMRPRLVAAGCTTGRVRYQASTRYRRTTVIRLTPAPKTQLASQGAVSVVVSSGKPCRVPRVARGTRVARMKRKLRAAGCAAGRISRARSRRARGTVVRLIPKSGTRLSPRAKVRIVLSRGRR